MQRLIIAKYTLIEAHKRRLIVLFLSGVIFCLAMAAYAGSLAMMDKQAILAAFYGAAVRFMSVALVGIYLILIEIRNLEQENVFVWLGLPVSRAHYLMQKVLAYFLLTTVFTLFVALPLLWIGPDLPAVWRWIAGFYLELLVMVLLSLLLACLFRQPFISLSAFAAIYLFARSALEIFQHSRNIIEQGTDGFELVAAWLVKMCTYLVPKLEQFASASWLLHAENQADFAVVFPQALLFGLLLFLIALERLHKRGF
jgi:hypothetical protein